LEVSINDESKQRIADEHFQEPMKPSGGLQKRSLGVHVKTHGDRPKKGVVKMIFPEPVHLTRLVNGASRPTNQACPMIKNTLLFV
jgi:hypothetical protein